MLKFADYGRFAVDFQISRKNAPLALHCCSRYSIRSKELVNLVKCPGFWFRGSVSKSRVLFGHICLAGSSVALACHLKWWSVTLATAKVLLIKPGAKKVCGHHARFCYGLWRRLNYQRLFRISEIYNLRLDSEP
jgi:hypothetical protein